MNKTWVDILLLEANIVLIKPKKLMGALFEVNRNISWEMNLVQAPYTIRCRTCKAKLFLQAPFPKKC